MNYQSNLISTFENIHTKSTGTTSTNFIAIKNKTKKYLKKHIVTINQRETLETYVFNTVLNQVCLRDGLNSFIGMRSIGVFLEPKVQNLKYYNLFI